MVVRTPMGRPGRVLLSVTVSLGCTLAFAGNVKEPLANIPSEKRELLRKRLDTYVQQSRGRNWGKLYDLVSDAGRGGISRQAFVTAMEAGHGKQFANAPDLLEFRPDRAEDREDHGYDIYGCGKARREGMMFNGIAVIHAEFEHGDWFFTGWSFTDFPNEPCKHLSDTGWKPDTQMGWDQPMEEVRSLPESVPIHVDGPK